MRVVRPWSPDFHMIYIIYIALGANIPSAAGIPVVAVGNEPPN